MRVFSNIELDENTTENMDETQFLYDLDNRTCLSLRSTKRVNYLDVVIRAEGMTFVLRVTGKSQAELAAPFFIFKNNSENYPIKVAPDNVPDVSYRIQRNGWMDNVRLVQSLREPRAIDKLPQHQERILFVDNCSGHRLTPKVSESLNQIRTSLRYIPANSTHLCQPLDSFLIKIFKNTWRRKWDSEKMRCCEEQYISQISIKFKHRSFHWYLRSAVESPNEINAMTDENGISYAKEVHDSQWTSKRNLFSGKEIFIFLASSHL